MSDLPEMVSVETLADLLDLAPVTVRNYSAQGRFPAIVDERIPLRQSIRGQVGAFRASQRRGVEIDHAGRADAAATFAVITAALDRLVLDIDKSEAPKQLAKAVLAAILARLDMRRAYSIDPERAHLRQLAADIRTDAARLLGEEEKADV